MCELRLSVQEKHQGCDFVQISRIKSQIIGRNISLEAYFKQLGLKIEKEIGILSNFRNYMDQLINKVSDNYGLTYQQIQFIKLCEDQDFKNLSGQRMWLIFDQLNKRSQINTLKIHIQDKIDDIWQNFNKIRQCTLYDLVNQFKKFQQPYEQPSVNLKQTQEESLFSKTLVIEEAFTERLLNYFTQLSIQRTKLIYRASQNNFCTKIFRQKCYGIPNTLTIAINQFGYIVGGFTPVQWATSTVLIHEKQFLDDQTMKTFVFSLNNNVQFKQKFSHRIITRSLDGSRGPMFGRTFGYSFIIYDQADKNGNSYFQIRRSFQNQNYPQDTKQTHKLLTGNPDDCSKFKIKQWQVWQIIFQDPQKLLKQQSNLKIDEIQKETN